MCNLSINENDTSIIIRNLDPNKSHGWENLSVRMISFVVTLNLSIKGTLQEGKYSDCWKKGNVVLVHKKESKSLIKNYRPLSLLPILGKIFERLTYKDLFNHFYCNNLSQKFNLVSCLVILAFFNCCLLFLE